MSLTAADIAEILRLVEGSAFDELSLEFNGLKLNFKRGTAGGSHGESAPAAPPAVTAPAAMVPPTAATLPTATLPTAPPPPVAAAADADTLEVRSPMLGTFYRAPKPGAPPFVTVGAAVEEESIVGIIEVMKLMNTVRAQVRGTVAEIHAADGALVEYGELLLRVRKPV
jgi:acetyl-CoA carboxylase biotin carboxyl carrier protein